MLFLCINASSATEPLNETLGTDVADELAIDEVSSEPLSASGDTLVVDAMGEQEHIVPFLPLLAMLPVGKQSWLRMANI